ncbi:MAG TPA: MarP family serine protease [Mycobacteriales bacterium]|nr:MarP family serine protease [Mycobacteriales bacterium]
MHGDLLDVLLLGASALFAISGYRQGFVVGVLSFVGFLGGGVLGAAVAPELLRTTSLSESSRTPVAVGIVFLAASLGQVLASVAGGWVRKHIVWHPARVVDAVAGSAVSVVSLLLVAWLVGTAVASSPFTGLASQVRRSQVLATVDDVVPGGARGLFDSFRALVDDGSFPEVFGDLVPTRVRPVDPPDPALARSTVVTAVRSRIFKITGVARSCSRRIEGSGFLYAHERVMTNAHVVAGVRSPTVHVGDRDLDATVVLFDPDRDIAVLAVPGLAARPLAFTGPARAGQSAVVIGYPQDGPYRADAARIRGRQDARGPNIYDSRTVVREIYALRARVRPGNSGGPLVSPDGTVYGVVFAAAADDPQTGYALTAREVSADAAAGQRSTTRVSTQGCD